MLMTEVGRDVVSRNLYRLLHERNGVERRQLASGANDNYMNLDFRVGEVARMPEWRFFNGGDIAVTKNNRFSYVPEHTHSFIELNYMYSGRCTQYINNEMVEMHEGSLVMLDKDVPHRISYTDEDDILVNILIHPDLDLAPMFTMMPESFSVVSKVIANCGNAATLHGNLIVFDLQGHDVPTNLIETLIMQGLVEKSTRERNRSMEFVLSALIIELKALIEKSAVDFGGANVERVIPIISYINEHYDSVTLTSLSDMFGYNRNYLSNKLKKVTGKSFQELLDMRRLAVAQNLMVTTDLTNGDISNTVGYRNVTSLFRLFSHRLGITPDDYRARIRRL